jgi:NADPH:quinone reductase
MRRIEVARFGDEEVLQLIYDASPPAVPPPGHVQIAVDAAGVNPADTYIRAGKYEFLVPALPFTPGFDAAGTVIGLGDGVTSHRVGDRVWVSLIPGRTIGTYTTTLSCAAELAHPLPDHFTFAQGAAIGVPFVTAHRALIQRGNARRGERVLIHGASGGVGIPTVQMAVDHGMTVIGTASTPEGLDLVLAAGAHHVLNHSEPDHFDHVRDLTEGDGVDVIVEMRADLNLGDDPIALAESGRIVIVGARGPVTIAPRRLMVAEADVRGTALWNMTPEDFDEAHRAIQQLFEAGSIKPFLGPVLDLAEAAEAHRLAGAGHAVGKVTLNVSGA